MAGEGEWEGQNNILILSIRSSLYLVTFYHPINSNASKLNKYDKQRICCGPSNVSPKKARSIGRQERKRTKDINIYTERERERERERPPLC